MGLEITFNGGESHRLENREAVEGAQNPNNAYGNLQVQKILELSIQC